MNAISLREYAAKEGISLGTAYRRLWEGRVSATKCDGRWLISTSIDRIDEKREDLEEQALNELGGPVKLPKHPLLQTLDYARMLSRELGWIVLKSSTTILAEAIRAESKSRGVTRAKAYEAFRERVLADREKGVPINRAYFQEAKWRLEEASEPRPGDSGRARKKPAATEPGNMVPGASREQER
jgi:hypothetical protein